MNNEPSSCGTTGAAAHRNPAPPWPTGEIDGTLIFRGLLEHVLAGRDVTWEPFLEGVDRCWIYQHGDTGPAAAFIRFHPGARVPLHEHIGYEHIYVLSGSQLDENGETCAGTFLVNPPGTRHSILSKTGCIVLAIYEKPVKFIAAPNALK